MRTSRSPILGLALLLAVAPALSATGLGGGQLTRRARTLKDAFGHSYTQYDTWVYTDTNGTTRFQGATDVCSGTAAMPWDSTLDDVRTTNGVTYALHVDGGDGAVTVRTSAYPKFQVLGVTYAPPGPGSHVDYLNTDATGVSTRISTSFTNTMNFEVGFSMDMGWVNSSTSLGLDFSHTYSTATTEGTSKSASYNYNVTNPVTNLNANFIDHNYDQIIVWLNPSVEMSFTSATDAAWATTNRSPDSVNGYDTYLPMVNGACQMDKIVLLAGWLNGNIPWPQNDTLQRLARTWDLSMPNPGLTTADYAAILALDPWAQQIDPATGAKLPVRSNAEVYALTTDANGQNKRYSWVKNVDYGPNWSASGITLINAKTSSTSNTASATLTVSYGSRDTFALFTAGSKSTWSWTHSVENTSSSSTTNTSSCWLVTPNPALTLPMYSSISVYQDNLYGTFMFVYPGGNF